MSKLCLSAHGSRLQIMKKFKQDERLHPAHTLHQTQTKPSKLIELFSNIPYIRLHCQSAKNYRKNNIILATLTFHQGDL